MSIHRKISNRLLEDTLSDLGWAAAVKTDSGTFTADDHHLAWIEYFEGNGMDAEDAIEQILSGGQNSVPGAIEGFEGPDGKFYTREEAWQKWKEDFPGAVKRTNDYEFGDSEDLRSYRI